MNVNRSSARELSELLSPIGIAVIAYALFLTSFLIPTSAFEYYAGEMDLRTRDPMLFIFYSGCVALYVLGTICVRIATRSRRKPKLHQNNVIPSINQIGILIGIMGVAILLNSVSAVLIFKNSPAAISSLFAGNAQDAKLSLDMDGSLAGAQSLILGVTWWGMFRYFQWRKYWSTLGRKVVCCMVIICSCNSAFTSLLKVARYELLPLIYGILFIYLYFRIKESGFAGHAVIRVLFASVIGLVVLLASVSYLRGAEDLDSLITQAFGYAGPMSFNHLSYILHGKLRFADGGNGLYTYQFLATLPGLRNVPAFSNLFNLPETLTIARAEFHANQICGLNPSFNWVTAFGYYESDIGNWVYPFIYCQGVFIEFLWLSFERGKVIGLLLYPFASASVLLWHSYNFLTRPVFGVLLVSVPLIAFIEFAANSLSRSRMREGTHLPRLFRNV